MQKKSLLVALFCGALCLTGCIKNEESASVAQVRIAKAAELNSIATLNNAKAAAEAVYAQAKLTVAQADAKLTEAQAALVTAQAETEKVQAQLLAVQVELAEVKVEEEKVKLQMMQADLEARLAALEAEKAAAAAAEQYWINVLADLKDQAKINAVENQMQIIALQEKMDSMFLSMEGQKADSARVYAQLYFQALDSVAVYQAKYIEAKATKVLINRGALDVRDYIHEEIQATNDTIAMNEAVIAYLKEYQTMTPEEAEAALVEARKSLNTAYNAYKATSELKDATKEVVEDLAGKDADFIRGWSEFEAQLAPGTTLFERATEVVYGQGEAAKVDETGKTVGVYFEDENGNIEWAGKNYRFVPLWQEEDTLEVVERYPDIDVYDKGHGHNKFEDHILVKTNLVAPATIYYDNIKEVLDTAIAREEKAVAQNIADFKAVNDWWGDVLKAGIADNNDKIALHKKYIASSIKDTVDKYEKAYLAALAEADPTKAESAWKEFQEYMLIKYPTVSKKAFMTRYEADTNYQGRKADSLAAKSALDQAKLPVAGQKKAVKDAFEAYAEKGEGAFNKMLDSLTANPNTPAGKAAKAWRAFSHGEYTPETGSEFPASIHGVWNNDFANLEGKAINVSVPSLTNLSGSDLYYYLNDHTPEIHWTRNGVHAGSAQDSLLTAKALAKLAEKEAYYQKINVWLSVEGADAKYAQASAAESYWKAAETRTKDYEASAWAEYRKLQAAWEKKAGVKIDDVELAYNPDFAGGHITNAATFPTVVYPDNEYKILTDVVTYNEETQEWVDGNGEKARSYQAAVLNAVAKIEKQLDKVTEAELVYGSEDDTKEVPTAVGKAKKALADLEDANDELIVALGGDPETDKIEDFLDSEADELYAKYIEALDVDYTAVFDAWLDLTWAYGYYPDLVGTLYGFGVAQAEVPAEDEGNFGWLISNFNVDYKATMINFMGQEVAIAWMYGPMKDFNNQIVTDENGQWVPNYTGSLQYQVEQAQNMIDVVLPEWLANYTAAQNAHLEFYKGEGAKAIAFFNAYKAHEDGYKTWVADRQTAEEAYNDAKMAEFDAFKDYEVERALYEALEVVSDGGLWVYDPENNFEGVEGRDGHNNPRGFKFISVNENIENLEKENERLEKKNENLKQLLSDGKEALAIVNEALDEAIETIGEAIQIWNAIANQYKAILNGYLGIVEAVVEEEDTVEDEE